MDPSNPPSNFPQDVESARPNHQISVKKRRFIQTPLTYLLTGATFYFFWESGMLTGQGSISLETIENNAWTLDVDKTRAGDYWRMLSAHLLNFSWFSFLISLVINFMLCKQIEVIFRSTRTTLILLGVMLINSAHFIIFYGQSLGGYTLSTNEFGFRGIFMGLIGAMMGFLYAERGSLIAFVKDRAFLNYLFLFGLFLAIELSYTGLEIGAWIALFTGGVLAWGLRRSMNGSVVSGRLITILSLVFITGSVTAAIFPNFAMTAKDGYLKSPEEDRAALRELEFPEKDFEYYRVMARNTEVSDENCLRRGIYLLRANQSDAALEELNRAAKLKSTPFRHGMLGRAYLAIGNTTTAKDVFTKAIALDKEKNHPELFYWAAKAYSPEDGRPLLESFLKITEDSEGDIYKEMRESAKKKLQ